MDTEDLHDEPNLEELSALGTDGVETDVKTIEIVTLIGVTGILACVIGLLDYAHYIYLYTKNQNQLRTDRILSL